MAVEYFTCKDCLHPYAIVGEHHCEPASRGIQEQVRRIKRRAAIRIAKHYHPLHDYKNTAEIVKELLAPGTGFDRANDLIDELANAKDIISDNKSMDSGS